MTSLTTFSGTSTIQSSKSRIERKHTVEMHRIRAIQMAFIYQALKKELIQEEGFYKANNKQNLIKLRSKFIKCGYRIENYMMK